jgi:uncharacterized protein (DUF1501 family)
MLDTDISTSAALAHLHRPEHDGHVLDRRRFLQLVGMGVGAGMVSGSTGSLLDSLILGHDASTWAAGPVGPTDGVVVVIGMFGGNDGLNTIVPINDGNYYTMHGGLAVPAGQTLALDGDVGLHPALTELKRMWDLGELAIVDGVGYPDPDLSHFNSMAYWMAGVPNAVPTSGWIGRWLDGYLDGTKDLYAAAEVGTSLPLHLVGRSAQGTVVPPSRPSFGAGTTPRELLQYDAIRNMNTGAHGACFQSVSQAFIDQLDLAKTLDPVVPDDDQLPDDEIVARLEVAARLINANLGFRVLTAGWGDFDSHAGQPGQHTARMGELNQAVKRFYEVLDPAWSSRVTVMTFSEFGRTPWSNDGAGTDHGTSAPHFVFGRNVKGGRYGQRPRLDGLRRWDRMAHHVDFRSYYASIIDGWLGGGSSDVLGGSFENLGLFARGPGRQGDGTQAPGPAVVAELSAMTPLTPTRILDTRSGLGGMKRQLQPGERIRVQVAGKGGVPSSGATAVVANVTAVGATSVMYFTVYPGSTPRPGTSNLNGAPGRAVPNLVVMGIGDDGCIEVFNSAGQTDCLVDVFGYFGPTGGDRFVPVLPSRLFDTRTGTGIRSGKIPDRTPIDIQVAGRSGVPVSGATAVVMNLTVTQTESPGWMRIAPAGEPLVDTSNVNFFAGETVPNLAICGLGDDGRITLYGVGQGTHVLADVFGYFGADGDLLRTTPPQRLLDTRIGLGAKQQRLAPDKNVRLAIAGRAGVPVAATAVVLNVTATRVTDPTYVSVWPAGVSVTGTSNLNVRTGQTLANLVVCRLGETGAVDISNANGECDVIADLLGYFVD